MSKQRDAKAFGELYSAYAAGSLDPAFALLVETQASLRADIANVVRRNEIIAATFFEAEEPTEMSAGAVDRALETIDGLNGSAILHGQAANIAGAGLGEIIDLPAPLRDTVIRSMEDSDWRFTTTGIRRLALATGGAAETELYRLEPGAAVPRHSHDGNEYTLVVAGGFADETGSFGPGDLSVKGPEHTHQPIAELDGVCYALAVRDGGLRFTGLIGAVQRILGV